MTDLASLFPQVNSVSVVPVGLTRHRDSLPRLTPFTREGALACVEQVEAFAARCLDEYDSRIFFCSDELYLKAGLPLPPDEYYEGYPQLENGVGLLRLQETEFDSALEDLGGAEGGAPFSIATGVAAAPFMRALVEKAGANGVVYAVPNDFLGHTIDVAGLLTGGDLIAHLRGKPLGERLLLPQVMLRHGEGVFLDDLTPADLERALGVRVQIVETDGARLLAAMRGE